MFHYSSVIFSLLVLCATAGVYAAPSHFAKDCTEIPAPNNGAVYTMFSDSYQQLAVFTCEDGYAATGKTVLSCVDGLWDMAPPFCASVKGCNLTPQLKEVIDVTLLKCGNLKAPRYGEVNIEIGPDGLSEIATFSCAPGFYVSGSTALHCEQGVWKGYEPECLRVDCGEPEAPENGTVEFEGTLYRDRAHYKCGECYVLNGYESRVCKQSGLWSKTTPECVLMDDIAACSLPSIPNGGFIPNEKHLRLNGVECSGVVKIRCFHGFSVEGSDTATCNPDGTYTWHNANNTPPTCRNLGWI